MGGRPWLRWPRPPGWYMLKLRDYYVYRPFSLRPMHRRTALKRRLDRLNLPVITRFYAAYYDNYMERMGLWPPELLKRDWVDPRELGYRSVNDIEMTPALDALLRKMTRLWVLSFITYDRRRLLEGFTDEELRALGFESVTVSFADTARTWGSQLHDLADRTAERIRSSPALQQAYNELALVAPEHLAKDVKARVAALPVDERQRLIAEIEDVLEHPEDRYIVRRGRRVMAGERRRAAVERAAALAERSGEAETAAYLREHGDTLAQDLPSADAARDAVSQLRARAAEVVQARRWHEETRDLAQRVREAGSEEERAAALRQLFPTAQGAAALSALDQAVSRLAQRDDTGMLDDLRRRAAASGTGEEDLARLADRAATTAARLYPEVQREASRAASVLRHTVAQFVAGYSEGKGQQVDSLEDAVTVPEESQAKADAVPYALGEIGEDGVAASRAQELDRHRDALRALYEELVRTEAAREGREVRESELPQEPAGGEEEKKEKWKEEEEEGVWQRGPSTGPSTLLAASEEDLDAITARLRQEVREDLESQEAELRKKDQRRWARWRMFFPRPASRAADEGFTPPVRIRLMRWFLDKHEAAMEEIAREEAQARGSPPPPPPHTGRGPGSAGKGSEGAE